ncbi:MAG: prokaryotic ubiquitin-like protein Pup [Actinomycetota bacterium]|jgi:ubiquitin-like protein Pup|nr:prokaryotic ubiquitin-like protein Pup [Actinomycetota bacterium]
MPGEQTRKPKPREEEAQESPDEHVSTSDSTKEVDDLLDEIDAVLESNAEDFVRAFVQKGGE